MPELTGQRGWRDGQDGALGVGQAVAAHLGTGHPGQRAGAAGKVHQDPACRAACNARLHQRAGGDLAPHRDERVAEPLAGEVLAGPAQIPGMLETLVAVAAGGSQAITGIKTAPWARARPSP